MKLRVRDNTVRLRLTQPEVAALARGDTVEATTVVAPGQVFRYRLESWPASAVSASYAGGELVIRAPAAVVQAWAASTEEGFSAEQAVPGGEALKITVEKDFACLKPRDPAEDRHAFPHPRAAC